jgi:hypothetical protein
MVILLSWLRPPTTLMTRCASSGSIIALPRLQLSSSTDQEREKKILATKSNTLLGISKMVTKIFLPVFFLTPPSIKAESILLPHEGQTIVMPPLFEGIRSI